MAVGGLGGIIMAVIAIFVFKQDPQSVISNLGGGGGGSVEEYKPTAAEQELAEFASTVLAYTEDIWDELYPYAAQKIKGQRAAYQRPKLVLFSGQTRSACGLGEAAMGPFYCPGDNQVYIDLAFFNELEKKLGAPGDFAQAYVIAHEVGHHVQNLLGLSSYVHQKRRSLSKAEYNKLSVKLELQADYFAGVWAHRAQKQFNILERGDLEEGLGAAGAVGDDTIQKRARGYVVPDSFTHGTAQQRIRWFKLGLKSGDPTEHDPFQMRYEEL